MNYANRRYRVVNGKLEKHWKGGDENGWFVKKIDALEASIAATPRLPPAEDPAPAALKVVEPDSPPRDTLTLKRKPGRPKKIYSG